MVKREFVTQAEYARRYGVNRSSVNRALKTGRLPSCGGLVDASQDIRKNRLRVPQQEYNDSTLSALQKARLAKINVDTEAQQQKLDRYQNELLQQFSTMAVDTFYESFAGFKNNLIGLRLNAEQLKTLREIWDRCVKDWVQRMKKFDSAGEH